MKISRVWGSDVLTTGNAEETVSRGYQVVDPDVRVKECNGSCTLFNTCVPTCPSCGVVAAIAVSFT